MDAESPATTIARALKERGVQGRTLIRKAVRLLGAERTWAFARQAQEIEKQGVCGSKAPYHRQRLLRPNVVVVRPNVFPSL